jgi:hypothetical protein
MRDDLSLVYITSNRESEYFESKIIETMKESINGLPVVSVSQKPIDFGENICLGDIGAKEENILKQLIIGAKSADTKFITIGESDFLYPKEFFEFVPPRDDTFYYPEHAYIFWVHHSKFYRKNFREMLSVTNREYFVETLETILYGYDGGHISKKIRDIVKQDTFWTDIPLLTFKTKQGLHWKSPFSRHDWKRELPQWGTADQLREKYCEKN